MAFLNASFSSSFPAYSLMIITYFTEHPKLKMPPFVSSFVKNPQDRSSGRLIFPIFLMLKAGLLPSLKQIWQLKHFQRRQSEGLYSTRNLTQLHIGIPFSLFPCKNGYSSTFQVSIISRCNCWDIRDQRYVSLGRYALLP